MLYYFILIHTSRATEKLEDGIKFRLEDFLSYDRLID